MPSAEEKSPGEVLQASPNDAVQELAKIQALHVHSAWRHAVADGTEGKPAAPNVIICIESEITPR